MLFPQTIMGNADGFEELMRTAIEPFIVARVEYNAESIEITPHDTSLNDVLHSGFPLNPFIAF
jgi:hypothetical protein